MGAGEEEAGVGNLVMMGDVAGVPTCNHFRC